MIGRVLFIMSVWAVPGLGVITSADAAEGNLENVTVAPLPVLGLSFPGDKPKRYKALSRVGIGVARLSASWAFREPEPGKFVWSGLDKRVIALQKLGIEPFLTFESDAKWAVRKETSHLTNGTPKDINQWSRYVRKLVERYDGDGRADAPGLLRPIRMYQVANEWNTPTNKHGGWMGTTQELIGFINATYDAVKAQDPKAKVVLGGITSGGLDRLAVYKGVADYEIKFREGPDDKIQVIPSSKFRGPGADAHVSSKFEPVLLKARYDLLDLHLYGPPDHDPARAKAIRSIVGDRPLLSAECGGPSMHYNDRYRPADHFMEVFARNMIVQSEGLKFCLWFRLVPGRSMTFGNSQTALYGRDRKPKPGYGAFILLAAIMTDMERVERRGKQHTFVVHRKGNTPLFVSWLPSGAPDKTVTLPKNAKGNILRVTDPVRGRYVVVPVPASRKVKLGQWPVIVGDLPKALISVR